MNNPFKLYEGEGYSKENKKVTREIKEEIKRFGLKIREIMVDFKNVGANDTESRGEIIDYLVKKLKNGEII